MRAAQPVPRWLRSVGETVRWLQSLPPPDVVQLPVMSFTVTLEDKPDARDPDRPNRRPKPGGDH